MKRYILGALVFLGVIFVLGCGSSGGGDELLEVGDFSGETTLRLRNRKSSERCLQLGASLNVPAIDISESSTSGQTDLIVSEVFLTSHGAFKSELARVPFGASSVTFDRLDAEQWSVFDDLGETSCVRTLQATTLTPSEGTLDVHSDIEFSCVHEGETSSCELEEFGTLQRIGGIS